MLTFKEITRVISKRYHIDAALAAETTKDICSDHAFNNEVELIDYLRDTEEII